MRMAVAVAALSTLSDDVPLRNTHTLNVHAYTHKTGTHMHAMIAVHAMMRYVYTDKDILTRMCAVMSVHMSCTAHTKQIHACMFMIVVHVYTRKTYIHTCTLSEAHTRML